MRSVVLALIAAAGIGGVALAQSGTKLQMIPGQSSTAVSSGVAMPSAADHARVRASKQVGAAGGSQVSTDTSVVDRSADTVSQAKSQQP